MTIESPFAFVYGLFTPSGKCIYVGCTVRPSRRRKELRAGRTGPRGLIDYKWRFRKLAKCEVDQAGELELQTIRHYKSKGEAILNRAMHGHHGRTKTTGCAVRCKNTGDIFFSLAEAGRHLGCGGHNISNALRKRNGKVADWICDGNLIFERVPELSWPHESKQETKGT